MTATVKALLDVIESLPQRQREEFDRAFNDRLEQEFLRESRKAGQLAKKRGMTLAYMDREIERRRYAK